jgi:hypothetical protein
MLSLHESPVPIATNPDLTALWEAALKKIAATYFEGSAILGARQQGGEP